MPDRHLHHHYSYDIYHHFFILSFPAQALELFHTGATPVLAPALAPRVGLLAPTLLHIGANLKRAGTGKTRLMTFARSEHSTRADVK